MSEVTVRKRKGKRKPSGIRDEAETGTAKMQRVEVTPSRPAEAQSPKKASVPENRAVVDVSEDKQESKTFYGPKKGSSNIRVVTRVDYQPDVCKDYNETGFCGYGDSCKFLHDRTNYTKSWKMEKEWEKLSARNAMLGRKEVKIDHELPFACHICRGPFQEPVRTKCGHYFCQECAMARSTEDHRCAICKEPTFGIFNRANELIKELAKRGVQCGM